MTACTASHYESVEASYAFSPIEMASAEYEHEKQHTRDAACNDLARGIYRPRSSAAICGTEATAIRQKATAPSR